MTDSTLYTVEDGWIELVDGTPFYFGAEPWLIAGMVEPEAIAHSLSYLCRYNGHTSRFYTVLEHTYIMAEWVERQPWSTPRDILTALHHEDAESIIGDMARPIKVKDPVFKGLDDRLTEGMAMRFGFEYPFPTWLKDIDARILKDERGANMNPSTNEWGTDALEALEISFRPWLSRWPWLGRKMWLRKHRRWTREMQKTMPGILAYDVM